MKPLIFAHIGLIVPNVKEGLEQYSDTFGATTASIYDFEPQKSWYLGEAVSDCKLQICLRKLVPGCEIELIAPLSANTPHAQFLRRTGGGLHHIAFQTEEYDQWREFFKQQGIKILFEAEVEDEVRGYRRCLYVDVGFQHSIEIFERNNKAKP
jgi:catechol 2,3-dioxygenase-like lactoylglutathione lyase family enzyme